MQPEIDFALAEALGVPTSCVPESLYPSLRSLFSQTSLQERLSLYAVARHGYSGEGDIFDVGCAAGGSTACLAAGVADSGIEPKENRVHAFDLFGGYSVKVFADGLKSRPR